MVNSYGQPYTPETNPTVAFATVATGENSSSGSYADLATVGPSVTVMVPASGRVRITIGAKVNNNNTFTSYMSWAASGANTIAASTPNAFASGGTLPFLGSRTRVITGLTPGSTTFTAKYVVDSGQGTWSSRDIIVEPLA